MSGKERAQWIGEAGAVVDRVRAAIAARPPGEEVLFVLVARGGLIFLPPVLASFPNANVCVISCDRARGITSTMPLPPVQQDLVVVLDAVVASGATIANVLGYLRPLAAAREYWVASLSCTRDGRARLEALGASIFNHIDDDLVDGAPSRDMDGADAGEVFQGFVGKASENPARLFSAIAHDEAEGDRRASIHAAVLDVVRSLAPSRLLDLGCGDGVLTCALAREVRDVVGANPEASHDARGATCGARFIEWGGLRREAPFDLVNVCMVLNAVEDVSELLDLAASLSAPGGRQVWTVLHPAFSFNESFNLARRAFEGGAAEVTIDMSKGYLCPHDYTKVRHGLVIRNHHRPIAWYIAAFAECGFALETLIEPPPHIGASNSLLPRVIMFVTRR